MRIRCGWYAWGRIRNSDSEDRRTARRLPRVLHWPAAGSASRDRRTRRGDEPAIDLSDAETDNPESPGPGVVAATTTRTTSGSFPQRLRPAGGYRAAVSELVAILARPAADGRQVGRAVWFGADWAALVSGGARPRVGEVFWLGLFSTRHSRCRCAPRPSRRVARHQDLRGCAEPGRGAPESVTTLAAVMGAATSAPAPSRPPRGTGCRAPRSCPARRCPPRSGPGRDARASRPSATARTARRSAPSTTAGGTRSARQHAGRPPASCLR